MADLAKSNGDILRALERIVMTGILLLSGWILMTVHGMEVTIGRMDERLTNTASKVELTRLEGTVGELKSKVNDALARGFLRDATQRERVN